MLFNNQRVWQKPIIIVYHVNVNKKPYNKDVSQLCSILGSQAGRVEPRLDLALVTSRAGRVE